MARRIGVALVGMVLLVPAIWWALHPDVSDRKNLAYPLWKLGLPAMDVDQAVGTWGYADGADSSLVRGRSREQLLHRFGYLLNPREARPYLRECYESTSWKGRDVAFVRDSNVMIVFERGKAAETVLVKGWVRGD